MAKYLSIEIGSKSISIVEGSKRANGVDIFKYDNIIIPEDSLEDGKIVNMALLVETLGNAIKKNSISAKKVIFIINSNSVISRVVNLPVIKGNNDILAMIKYELQQYLPINLDDYKFIYKIAEKYKEEGVEKAKYSIHCLPNDIYSGYIELAERLKLTTLSVELVFNNLDSIHKNNIIINRHENETNKIIGFINFDYSSITLSVLNKETNDFSRTISGGITEIVDTLKQNFDMDYDETIMLLKNISLVDEIDIFSIDKSVMVRDILSTWVSELNRYIKYYNSRSKDISIDKIYVYGNHIYFNKFAEYLTQNLGIEVEIIESIDGLNVSTVDKSAFDIKIYFNCILGLNYNKKDIHFMSSEIKAHKNKFGLYLSLVTILLIVSCFGGYFILDNYLEVKSYKEQISHMNEFIKNEENINKAQASVQLLEKIDMLSDYVDDLGTVKSFVSNLDCVNANIIRDIALSTPQDTRIATISIDNGTIQLQCISTARTSSAQFQKNLKQIDYISGVYIPTLSDISKDGVIEYFYSIVCNIKGVDNHEVD